MLLLHLSDLHLTRYGEPRKWTQLEGEQENWALLHSWHGWRIEGIRDRKGRPDRLRLVDPAGIVHTTKKWPTRKEDKLIAALLSVAMKRQATSSEELIRTQPTRDDLSSLLRIDPNNTNLRFLQLVHDVLPLNPAIVVITGDITDNGLGYGLVKHYLQPWIEKKRLMVVPGNHDTYEMFPGKGRKARLEAKLERYQGFAEAVDMAPEKSGAYLRWVDDIAFVGLSSCKPPLTPLSASGEVSSVQLKYLRELSQDSAFKSARQRVCLMHHHVLRMPLEFGKRGPIEVGLRLRNAKEVMSACTNAQIDLILHGHRHHGYLVKLPGHPMVVSSPSSTWGCQSTELRYVWTMDLSQRVPFPEIHRFTMDQASPLTEDY
ncbi:MAG: metallophosphoesterase [Deltaproteobacteria bacterium]|nr:metallophosphoesterase [Deltaproteobacteria bacterium]